MKSSSKRRVWSPESERAYAPQRISRAAAGNQQMLLSFRRWLTDERGLATATITAYIGSACTFVDAVAERSGRTGVAVVRSLSVRSMEVFFVEYGKTHSMYARRNMATAMRSFLEFAVLRGWTHREMADSVPSLIGYRLSDLPRGASDEQVAKLLAGMQASEFGRCRLRDCAIVWLLVTYGVRRSQVSALRLADIDWSQRTIEFAAHKGGKAVHQTLTPATAQKLSEYLRRQRPESESEYVFLRHRRPHTRLSPTAITVMLAAWAQRCGLPRLHPHALRHAFATRLLRTGQPIKTIADLLGHRSLGAVSIYAKVDFARLIEVAVEWPEEATP
ncbi:MAG: tyrosine-type recombinase/integrase [Thermoanaerobaculia bacterium]|nr:tyrosine-type recombinase/integrase [Thermoanaerobaculia bacterium]